MLTLDSIIIRYNVYFYTRLTFWSAQLPSHSSQQGSTTVLIVLSTAVSFDLWWNSVATMLFFLQAQ